MKKFFYILFILSSSFLYAQIGSPSDDEKGTPRPTFFVEALTNKSSETGKTRLDFYMQVPFSSVQFIRTNSIFSASYTVNLTIYDENKENIFYDQGWVEKLSTEDFNEANSPYSSNYSLKSIELNPGKYSVYCSIEDNDSKKLSYMETPLNIRGFSDSLEIGDVLLIDQIIKDKDGEQLIPNVSRVVTTKRTELPLLYDIFSDKDADYTITYSIIGPKGDTLLTASSDQKLKKGNNKIFYTIKNTKFSLGEIRLGISVCKGNDVLKNYVKVISGRIYGLPVSISSIDEAVEQMIYVSDDPTVKYIQDTTNPDEKLKKFIDYWDSKKPNKDMDENPIMKEYYKRVEYSNAHFKGMPSGWKSDMGMVYIILGPPDTIERHPIPADSRPYEYWYYSRYNKTYLFLDVTGFGTYRLQNPDYDLFNSARLR